MDNRDQEGPKTYSQPATKQTICNGCKHLEKTAGLRSRTEHRDNYGCLHPDSIKDELGRRSMSVFGLIGRVIGYNVSYPCDTPSWCPFLKSKKNEATKES
jgi:hypothetical protein